MSEHKRPSKKQRELLTFIDNFISGHGYGPSYREIQSGMGYKSVSTVANHVDNLIAKGLLIKKTYSARSLEVVGSSADFKSNQVTQSQEKWLVEHIDRKFEDIENSNHTDQHKIDELYVLVGALQILGFTGAASSFKARLKNIKQQTSETQ